MIYPDSIRAKKIKVEYCVQYKFKIDKVFTKTGYQYCNSIIIRNNDPVGSLYVSKIDCIDFIEAENVNKWDKLIVPPSSTRKLILFNKEQTIYLVNINMIGEDVEIIQAYDEIFNDINSIDDNRAISYISDLNIIKPSTNIKAYEKICTSSNVLYTIDIHTPIDIYYSKLILSDYNCISSDIMRLCLYSDYCISSTCDKIITIDNLHLKNTVKISSSAAGKKLYLYVLWQAKGIDTLVTP